MYKFFKIGFFFFFLFALDVQAQSTEDFKFFEQSIKGQKTVQAIHVKSIEKDKNEIQRSGYLALHVYKKYITTQDGNYCNFIPSCSSFCAHALHKHGAIKGAIMTFDRLARCHGFSAHKYEKNLKYRKLIDEVK